MIAEELDFNDYSMEQRGWDRHRNTGGRRADLKVRMFKAVFIVYCNTKIKHDYRRIRTIRPPGQPSRLPASGDPVTHGEVTHISRQP